MLLTNRTIELVSSSILVLSNLIPAFLKLIYPIKFDYTSIPVISIKEKEKANIKSIHFYGLLNKTENFFKNLSSEGCVIVDCDTNQIFRYKKYVSFCPLPSSELTKNKQLNLKFYRNKIMKYKDDKKLNENQKYEDIKFLENGKIFIDCDSQNNLVLEHNYNYLTDKEYAELRKNINFIKNADLNFDSIDKKKINKRIFNPEREKRSFDYKINKLFTEMIYNKLINQQDPLTIDMRVLKNFKRFKQDFQFDNHSPMNLMQNLKIFNEEFSYFNSFVIKQKIFDFPFNEAKNFLSNINNFDSIYSSYVLVKDNLNNDLKNEKNKDYNLIHNYCLNFYGENGLFHLFNLIKENIKDKENEFFIQCYNKLIFDDFKCYLQKHNSKDFKDNNDENKEKNNFIEFYINNHNEINYLEISNFYIYLSFILNQMKESKLYKEEFNEDLFNNKIINYFNLGYQNCPHNFPFFDFYKYLDQLSLKQLNGSHYYKNKEINKCLVKIIEKIRNIKMNQLERNLEKLIQEKFTLINSY